MTKLRILVVEDRPNWRELLERTLRDLSDSVRVECAPNYGTALQHIQQTTYDAAIVDMSLVGRPTNETASDHLGVEFLRELRASKHNSTCAMVFLTAYGIPEPTRDAMIRDYGVYRVIQKEQFDIASFLTTVQDAIEDARNRTVSQLEARIVALVDFLYTASHELRRPLGHMKVILQDVLAEAREALTEHQERSLNRALRSLEDAIGLADRLLQVSQFEAASMGAELSPCSVVECVRGAVERIQPRADRKGLILTTQLPQSNIVIEADSMFLMLVVENLLDNAVKFTDVGELGVRCWEEDDAVYIEVWDTGVGISEDRIDHLFDPPFQALGTPTKRSKGLGAGLYLVKKWLDMHSGRIEVRSGVGKGSSFRVFLPRSQSTN